MKVSVKIKDGFIMNFVELIEKISDEDNFGSTCKTIICHPNIVILSN